MPPQSTSYEITARAEQVSEGKNINYDLICKLRSIMCIVHRKFSRNESQSEVKVEAGNVREDYL